MQIISEIFPLLYNSCIHYKFIAGGMNLLMPYNFADIESKWQKRWNDSHCFESHTDPSREKFFCLEMFPYPSGALHMGHIRNYSIGDVLARFLRKNGRNVLYTTSSSRPSPTIGPSRTSHT